MNFPYLYADMSLKRAVILSILSASAIVAYASAAANDTIVYSDTIWFDDGAWYVGEIADSMFNGYGTMVYADSTIYKGEWKDGLWDGQGELLFPDGDSYNGEFREHEFNGYGSYFYSNGTTYEGYWQNGMFNGSGTMNYADGSIYAGEWKDDKKHGTGVFYNSATGSLLKGQFRNDTFIPQSYETNVNQGYNQSKRQDDLFNPYISNRRPDSCWHYRRDAYICFTYGTSQMLSFHADFYNSQYFFAGFSLGFNTLSHRIGEVSVTYDDETGEKITLIGWDWFLDEILTENKYTMFKLSAECGLSWKWFSIGAAAGLGLQNTIRNCRSLAHNPNYYEANTLYYREKVTGVKLTYDIFTDFILSRSIPNIHSCSLRTGYGNIDGLFIGAGLTF